MTATALFRISSPLPTLWHRLLNLSISFFVLSADQTYITLPIARSLPATNVKFHSPAIILSIVPISRLLFTTRRSTMRIIFLIEVASILRRGLCYDWFHVHVVCTHFSFSLSFLSFLIQWIHARYAWTYS